MILRFIGFVGFFFFSWFGLYSVRFSRGRWFSGGRGFDRSRGFNWSRWFNRGRCCNRSRRFSSGGKLDRCWFFLLYRSSDSGLVHCCHRCSHFRFHGKWWR